LSGVLDDRENPVVADEPGDRQRRDDVNCCKGKGDEHGKANRRAGRVVVHGCASN
jgi:hypothetical protein